MYIISIIALIVVILILASFTGPSIVLYLVDLPSLILLLLITLPILFSSGLLKDFGKAFNLVIVKNKEVSLVQLKKSLEAVSLAIKTNFYASGFITIFGCIQVLKEVESLDVLGHNLAVAILSFAYALAINIVLISIKYKLKLMILNFTQD